ncbi:hypothetical protein D3H55_22680 [Bacillus salacetis]|uniref:Uncharacterized protein n=1 Tax=Bacillus salacetis TaxID=2315464 RepID=A0A3A1QNR6_9BACI|nr:hypothetical protein [Bacillus salacetis]RIW27651.1 hypothetical protein D3H55_22680 [Bacillus salacetis]
MFTIIKSFYEEKKSDGSYTFTVGDTQRFMEKDIFPQWRPAKSGTLSNYREKPGRQDSSAGAFF